jgi:predicted  nucleic acid-binding Zn-ribbon protein
MNRVSRRIKKEKTKLERTTDKKGINRLTAKIKRLQQSERRERDKLKESDKLKEKKRKKVKKGVLNFLRIPNFRRKTQKRGSLLSHLNQSVKSLSKNIPQTTRKTRTKITTVFVPKWFK